ncbi:MAG: hypothetical protein FJ271_26225 [Planctomycetes bacterium]|nr:hypothetical protein [Planctomycetota bacterium]
MIFNVHQPCRNLGLRAGAILFRDLRIGPRCPELNDEIAREVAATRGRFPDAKKPEVSAFLDILRSVGVNPRKVQHSVEKLLACALKRGDLPAINNFVDTYNLLSLRSLCSLGAHDVDRLTLPVTLRLLQGDETFTPLGRAAPEPVRPGEFGYVAGDNRLLCRLDVMQADFSKVTDATRNALLIIEATASHSPATVRGVFDAALDLVPRFCGGSGEIVDNAV